MAWYNKYRPNSFEEVIGQDIIKTVLEKSLDAGKIKHAYLFNGPKGVGKTTIARIFANKLNNTKNQPEASIDLVEMDAASNTGIDDVRLLIESAKNPPLIGKYKVYLIDEVHMLSKSAMNALLKILEEPPSYLVFLLATTNPEKLIPTVLSRLTKLNLTNHSTSELTANLRNIANKEGLNIEENVLEMLAKRADGSQRDAINLLETLSSFGLDNFNLENSGNLLGLLPDSTFATFTNEFTKTESISSQTLTEIKNIGLDGESFLTQLLNYLLDESILGNNNNSFIQTVAKVLDLRLPSTTILQSIALLQAFSNNNLQISYPKNLESLVTENKVSKPEIKEVVKTETQPVIVHELSPTPTKQEIREEAVEEVISENFGNEENKASVEESGESIAEVETAKVESIQAFLNKLGQHKELPPMLKMVIPDIKVESIDSDLLNISSSSGIFLSQLNSEKIKSWLIEQIQKTWPNIQKLNSQLRNNLSFTPTPVETAVDPVPIRTQEVDKKYNHPEQGGNKYFYEVYNQLPKEMEPETLPVFNGEISKPVKSKSWDDQANELFDFE
jgi:DNA polymerase III subunit gamma/tau